MTEFIYQLRVEHKNSLALLDILEKQITRIDSGCSADFRIVAGITKFFNGFPDKYHHPKEELLYEKQKKKDPTAFRMIEYISEEHRVLKNKISSLSEAIDSALKDSRTSRRTFSRVAKGFIAFQREHIALEEGWFYPRIEHLFTSQDWSDVAGHIMDTSDPLVDASAVARFERLRRTILEWAREDHFVSA
ncbi:MAG: hemerythrin domain-containing protein [Rhodospirillaceae bacterium]